MSESSNSYMVKIDGLKSKHQDSYLEYLKGKYEFSFVSSKPSKKEKHVDILIDFESQKKGKEFIDHEIYTTYKKEEINLIEYSKKMKEIIKSQKGNVVMKNIPKNIGKKELYDAFTSAIGPIISIKIPVDDKHDNLGYLYILFEKPEDAAKCINEFNGSGINGNIVILEKYEPKVSNNGLFTNLYFKNLPQSIDSDTKLERLVSPYGDVVSPKLKIDLRTKKLTGCAYCSVKTHDDAVNVIENLNGANIDGKIIEVEPFQKKQEIEKQRGRELVRIQNSKILEQQTLFVSKAPINSTKDSLIEFFGGNNVIIEFDFDPNKNTMRIEFKSKEATRNALLKSVTHRYKDFFLKVEHYQQKIERIRAVSDSIRELENKLRIMGIEPFEFNRISDDQAKLLLENEDLIPGRFE